MASTSISVDEDQFCCPVCLDILRDPVTIPCGHSYCMDCIKGFWRKNEHKGVYSCPQCRRTFSPRPVLARNTMLADIVDKLKKTEIQDTLPAQRYAKTGDVECDICIGRRHRAVKSCTVCLASFCQTHLKHHNEVNHGRTHKIIEPTKLQKKICTHHNKLFEAYCRTDQQCICCQCVTDGHKGHNTVPAAEERIQRQEQMNEAWRRSKQKIKEREKRLRRMVKYLKRSAQAAEEDSERIFSKMIRSIERRHCEVKELIRDQERSILNQTERLLEQLEQQMAENRKREAELEQLSHTDNHIYFLQRCKPLSAPPDRGDPPSIEVHPYFSFTILKRALTEFKERVNDLCDREIARISDLIQEEEKLPDVSSPRISAQTETEKANTTDAPQTEPKTRADFLQYCCEVTLDPNTANSYLRLSEGNREVTTGYEAQPYTNHPERFASWAQVLCKQGLAGRCYWETEWSGSGGVSIGVSYKEIARDAGGTDGKLGCNSKSWSLDFSDSVCSFQHNKKSTDIPIPHSRRIGTYLDHVAGTLAFYSVSETMTLLHRVQTTFSQPLYPAFWVGLGSKIKLCPIFNF
ncbi:tripartite motif-containing protein 16 [Chanos chanos]|uniref:Tripartite motif-containing protein 16 n=1 Tax=Chanos chanos TaxID=29144 RepID=A0A6J2VGT6_CHACN|nr:tripartite motif-containing protein 16-like [Chanos chanos]